MIRQGLVGAGEKAQILELTSLSKKEDRGTGLHADIENILVDPKGVLAS